ncbi:YdcF family protein [Streptococcus merionis]|uniref:YdcF family protein n=1 Tax=Streptococcus merionis TaxID=400065 RepID=UPI003513C950
MGNHNYSRHEVDMTAFFFFNDELEMADLAIIPGTSQTSAVDCAKELLDKGLVPSVLISGGVNPKLDGQTEANFLAAYASSISISKNQLLLEEHASNTFENARLSAQLCQREGLKPQKRLEKKSNFISHDLRQHFNAVVDWQICSCFTLQIRPNQLCGGGKTNSLLIVRVLSHSHARRVLMTFEEHFLPDTAFQIKSYQDEKGVSPETWTTDPSQKAILYQELAKIGHYYLKNK